MSEEQKKIKLVESKELDVLITRAQSYERSPEPSESKVSYTNKSKFTRKKHSFLSRANLKEKVLRSIIFEFM